MEGAERGLSGGIEEERDKEEAEVWLGGVWIERCFISPAARSWDSDCQVPAVGVEKL